MRCRGYAAPQRVLRKGVFVSSRSWAAPDLNASVFEPTAAEPLDVNLTMLGTEGHRM